MKRNRLSDVADHVGAVFEGRAHRALADARVTANVFLEMHRVAETRYSRFIDTADDIRNFIAELKSPSGEGEFSLPLIEKAIGNRIILRFDYVNGNSEKTINRDVQPLRIELRGELNYMVAFCLLRLQERTFRVSSMANVREMSLVEPHR